MGPILFLCMSPYSLTLKNLVIMKLLARITHPLPQQQHRAKMGHPPDPHPFHTARPKRRPSERWPSPPWLPWPPSTSSRRGKGRTRTSRESMHTPDPCMEKAVYYNIHTYIHTYIHTFSRRIVAE